MLADLPACQETRSRPGPLASVTGVPIALEIGGGAPQNVRSAFATELSAAATARRVDVTGAGSSARYRVRGYLAAETTAEGDAALAFVWDVSDDQNRLAKRLTGSSPLETASPDPWAGLDKAALARLAERSMDEIVGFLSADAAGNPPPT
jgi:hypothetical protein